MTIKLNAFAALVISASALVAHAAPASVYTEAGANGGPAHAVLVSADGVLAESDIKPNPFEGAYFGPAKGVKPSQTTASKPRSSSTQAYDLGHMPAASNPDYRLDSDSAPAPAKPSKNSKQSSSPRTYTEAGPTESTYSKVTVDDNGMVAQSRIDPADFSSASFPNANVGAKLKAKAQKTSQSTAPSKPNGAGL
jgi:hypothetical protein